MEFPAKAALFSAAFLLLTGCAGHRGARVDLASWADAHGFLPFSTQTTELPVRALIKGPAQGDSLTIYIEGDGAPWPSIYRPPRDPSPEQPIVLSMAAQDGARAVAYLARPCQFQDQGDLHGKRAACSVRYWSEERFSEIVIADMDRAVSGLKRAAGANRLRLIGYSGGGVVAALIAERRNDVSELVTIAAPLDLKRWVAYHRISPLSGSLDPAAYPVRTPRRPAVHFVGERDRVVPPELVSDYARARGSVVRAIPGADHECCWAENWPRLLNEILEAMR